MEELIPIMEKFKESVISQTPLYIVMKVIEIGPKKFSFGEA